MNFPLILAACLSIGLGAVHSLAGEQYLLAKLGAQRDITNAPLLSPFQMNLIRGTWHTLTIFGFGLALLLFTLAFPGLERVLHVHSAIAIASALASAYWAYLTRFWNLAWLAFLIIAVLCWFC